LAMITLLDESELAAPFQHVLEDRYGDGQLEKQAKALDDAKTLRNKDKNMASFDTMLHKFQKPSEHQYDDLTESLKAAAPQPDAFDLALRPDQSGKIRRSKMATFDTEIQQSQKDLLGHVLSLVQTDSEEWTPSGQQGMSTAIAKTKADDEAEEDRADGFIPESDADELLFYQDQDMSKPDESANELLFYQDEDFAEDVEDTDPASWTPKGQKIAEEAVMNKDEVKKPAWVKKTEEEDEPKDILDAVHLGHLRDPKKSNEGLLTPDDVPDLGLVQFPTVGDDELLGIGAGAGSAEDEIPTSPPVNEGPPPPVQITEDVKKNCAFLQVFCELNHDTLIDHEDDLGVLGEFLVKMGQKYTKTEVIKGVVPRFADDGSDDIIEGDEHKKVKQTSWDHYHHVITTLQAAHPSGLPRYTLAHIEKAMLGDGVTVMGVVPRKAGNRFHINFKAIGLNSNELPLLNSINTPVSHMIRAVAKEQVAFEAVSAENAIHFHPSDYARVFKASCIGADHYDAKCQDQGDKASCDASGDINCEWAGAWDGSETPLIEQAEAAAQAYVH